ncbi:EAL domain-containing protein [Chromobacterium sp. IIBBL 290-4]|uniref:EAL domain-containing response regulator n=1 Tax=Chromobacterium sp. IIBBL 290-4 TaxID=2953890 RepID=UPI0020B7C3AD|nr:EAL domain-containing protein [Chromobacterium sp. IIBBL 290-4]UTH73074.1 EAL domain-containing protein [Chromobacterium sp. IIBBL 290-4]
MELKPKRFLILDDQLVLRKLISRQASFFSRYAVQIDEFSDPAEALRSIAEGGYQLVITDIGMPGMNGIDFIKNVSRLGYQSALLIISGYDGKTLQTIADMSVSLGISCTRFLSKPYSAEAFLASLNALFNEMEREDMQGPSDIERVMGDLCADNYSLEFEPVHRLADHGLIALRLSAALFDNAHRYDVEFLFQLLAGRQMASAIALETMVERVARLLQEKGGVFPEGQMNIQIDEACLRADNVFDHCFVILQQYGVSARRIGFELADGLTRKADALCFENIAKIKYLGFRLLADSFGSGSLTAGNLLKLPFDHVNVPIDTLSWMRTALGEDANAFRMLRYFGLSPAGVCATGLDDPESLALAIAMGCPEGRGGAVSPKVLENELQGLAVVTAGGAE